MGYKEVGMKENRRGILFYVGIVKYCIKGLSKHGRMRIEGDGVFNMAIEQWFTQILYN